MAKLLKLEHLCKDSEFQSVYQRKRSLSDSHLILYVIDNRLPYSRFGLSVSKKMGNAVQRNRIRRLLREAYRLRKSDIPTGFDFVIIPRPTIILDLRVLQNSLVQLSKNLARRIQREGQPNSLETKNPSNNNRSTS